MYSNWQMMLVAGIVVSTLLVAAGCRKPKSVTPENLPAPSEAPVAAETQTGALSDSEVSGAIAGFLGVTAGDVAPESSEESDRGYVVVATIKSATGADERVRVELSRDMQSLLACRWLNDPPQGEATVNIEQAKLVAQVLFDRWFPEVPVNMAREAMQIDPTTFMITWAARVTPDVMTGDRAFAIISAVDGRPLSWSQHVAAKRPKLTDIPVTAKRAVDVAQAALPTGADAPGTIEGGRAVLILSAPQSRTGEPLWFVDFFYKQPEGGQPIPPQKVAVNANSGEIETDLLEVQ